MAEPRVLDGGAEVGNHDPSLRVSFARDASGLEMIPDAVARPRSIEETIDLVRAATSRGMPVTTAGNQTSTTGPSITDSGLLLSLRGLVRILPPHPHPPLAPPQPPSPPPHLNPS